MKNLYSLPSVLDAFESLKEETWVYKLLNKAKEKIFWNNLNTENIEEFKTFVRGFTSIYYLMKNKFAETNRSTWERYFEHLRSVVNNVLDLPNPNTDKVFIAIAHDSIEDTNKTYEWFNEDFWYKIALWVQVISKSPWEDYIQDTQNITDDLKKEAKHKRNTEYFSHLKSLASMKECIYSLASQKWVKLSYTECIEIAINALDVKFADRIHNLSTQWDPADTGTVRRKVDETKEYLLDIAKETNLQAYHKLQSLILQLEVKLNNTGEITKKIVAG